MPVQRGKLPCPLSRFYCISRGAEQVRALCLDNIVISKPKPSRSIFHGQGEPFAAEPFSNLILTTVPCAHIGQGCHCILEDSHTSGLPPLVWLFSGVVAWTRWTNQAAHRYLPQFLASYPCGHRCLSECHSGETPRYR